MKANEELKNKMEIKLLTSLNSGKNVLVDSIKNIAKKVNENELKVNDITEGLINDETYSWYY